MKKQLSFTLCDIRFWQHQRLDHRDIFFLLLFICVTGMFFIVYARNRRRAKLSKIVDNTTEDEVRLLIIKHLGRSCTRGDSKILNALQKRHPEIKKLVEHVSDPDRVMKDLLKLKTSKT